MKKGKTKSQNSETSTTITDFRRIDVEGDIFKQIFKYSVIPTIVHDLEMNIIDSNDSALLMFGYTKDELLEKSIFDLHTEDELKHSAEVLDKMKQEKKMNVQTSFKRKDGSVFMAEATPCKYMIEDKPLIHVFIQDITEREIAKRKLQEFNSALEAEMAKVKTYTKQIESKNKELEEFSYVAAHDLKAPVTNIKILSDMINAETIIDEQSNEVFGKLKNSIEQLNKTVVSLNDVISFKSTLGYKKEKLNFGEIFDEIKESITEQLVKSKATINADFSECPKIEYPVLHLKSILQNLLTNAVKYRDPDKTLIIQVKTTAYNGSVCLSVKDNGMGFDASRYSEKVFGLFKRLHTGVEGMGVGMYIVKSIVDSHGGRIEVESKPQEGALFNVYF
ncbi:PAS domain-containing sensor histidine kinase [uncultured Algoriphagus sp.]|uniref:sensor histidine kinase n=1 Tax=uncultured Algoriphagus sp. TaxID=417365 RepID=UPI0030EB528B|tara:strand:+ start:197 stop:1369 length:1173 start_codon:yes stop_codon:yes gene_type:complete